MMRVIVLFLSIRFFLVQAGLLQRVSKDGRRGRTGGVRIRCPIHRTARKGAPSLFAFSISVSVSVAVPVPVPVAVAVGQLGAKKKA